MGIKIGHARLLRHRGSALFGVLSLLAASFLTSVAAAAPANAATPNCTISWSTAVNGNWNTAANWTDTSNANRLPTAADDVCISMPGTYTVTQDVNVSVNSLTVGGGQGLQTLLVPSGTFLSFAANSSVAATGVMTLGDSGNGNIYLRSSNVLTNAGTLNVVAGGGGARYLQTSIVNSGTLDVASANTISDTYVSVPTLTNTGTFKVEPGGGYTFSSGAGINNTAGTIGNAGSVSMMQSPFIQRGGSTTGNPILLTSGTLDDDATAGPGLFLVHGGTLTGTATSPGIAAGQTVTLDSGGIVSMTGNLTNAGTLNIGSAAAGTVYLRGSSVLTNAGTLNVVAGGGGARYLQTSIVNSGTLDVASANTISDTYVSVPTLTNTGTFKVEPGGGYTFSSGAGINNTAGTIGNAGSVSMMQSPFIQRGGSTTGNPILLTSGTLDDDATAGPGLFLVHGGTLTGTATSPGIAAGQTVTLDSGGIVSMTGNLTNAGILNVGNSNSGTADFRGGLLTNTGTLNVVAGGGEARYVRVSIANHGTMDIGSASTVSDTYVGVPIVTNSGTFKVEAGANYSFYSGAAFTQDAAGIFATFVDAASGAIGSIAGGPVHVDGTLQVTTTGTPALGTTYQVVSGATRTGTFATAQFVGGFYDVTYPSTGVTLTAKAAPLAAPVFTADSPPITATVGTAYSYTFVASGNPAPTYAVQTGGLPAGLSLDMVTGKLTGTPTLPGPSTFTIRATNAVNPPADSPPITITVLAAPAAPVFTADSPPITATVGTAYSYTFVASGNPAPTYAVQTGGLPAGLSLDMVTGKLTGTPTLPGPSTFTIRATNAVNPPADSPPITITVLAAPAAPVFTADSPPITATVGTAYSYTFVASGNPAPTYAVQTGGLPAGLSLDMVTGKLTGTPTLPGPSTFTIRATNAVNPPADSPPITITVLAAPAAPVFTADSPPITATVGTAYSYTFVASGNPAPTYAVQTGGLPAGLSLDMVTGKLTGTPTLPGPSTFTIRATNAVNPPADSPPITITVLAAPAAPVFTADSPPITATVGTAYSYTFVASGNPAPTYAVQTGGLPAGLSLDMVTGKLTGTPTLPGPSTFTIRATNAVNPPADSPPITITVLAAPAAPVFTADSPPITATVGTAYSYTFVASGNPAPTYAVQTGGLPAGLSLDMVTGKLTGTPTLPGPSTFTIRATNAVNPPADSPPITITVSGNGPIVTSVTPSTDTVLTPFSKSVSVRGSGFTRNSVVKFGTQFGYVRSVSADGTSLTVWVPPQSPGTVDVTVTTAASTSGVTTADQFTYLDGRPIVTSVAPSSGLVLSNFSSVVTVRGSGFTRDSIVRFGSQFGYVRSVSADGTSLTAWVPVQGPGTVDVTIRTTQGTSAVTPADRFTYLDGRPVVTSVTPSTDTVLSSFSKSVSVRGSGFTRNSVVKFGTQFGYVRSASADGTSLTVWVPPQGPGTVDVTVLTLAGTSGNTSADHFTYLAPARPVITSITPSTGDDLIGALVIIHGTGFTQQAVVHFGTAAGSVFYVSADGTSMFAYGRPQHVGTIDVTITDEGGTSAVTNADRVTYLPYNPGGGGGA